MTKHTESWQAARKIKKTKGVTATMMIMLLVMVGDDDHSKFQDDDAEDHLRLIMVLMLAIMTSYT